MDSKPVSTKRIRFPLLSAGLFALLLLAVYADPLFVRRNFVGRDLVAFGLPLEMMVHDAWARGRVPVWSEDLSGGRPLLPNPSAGVLYPVRPLLSLLPFPAAMRVFPVAQWFLGGLGLLLALRAVGASGAGAWVGAASFVFSGVLVSNVYYTPLLASATLLPWVFWAVARPARSFGVRAVTLGVVFGLLALLGDAFGFAIALLAAMLWIARETPRGARARELGSFAVGLALASLLAAPQIVATALLVPDTYRAVSGFPLREALVFTLSPWRLVELVVPFPFGRHWTLDDREVWSSGAFRPFYSTMYCGAFAAIALVALWKDRGRGARFGRALVVTAAFLAIVFRYVPERFRDSPSWLPLRHPEKFSTAIALGLAVLAALAVDRFRAGGRRPGWILGTAGLLTAIAAIAAVWPGTVGAWAAKATGASAAAAPDAGRTLAAAFAEAGLLWTASLIALELLPGGRAALIAGIALITLAPVAANRRIAQTAHEAAVFSPPTLARLITKMDPRGAFRTLDERFYLPPSPLGNVPFGDPYRLENDRQSWLWATPALWHRGTVLNLDPDIGDLARVASLRAVSSRVAKSPSAASFFGGLSLRFGVRHSDQPALAGYERFGGDRLRNWDVNPRALPDLRLLERWREEAGAVGALQSLPGLSEGEVVLEGARKAAGSARPGRLSVLEKTPERMVLEADCPDPTWLFVLRGYWTYRRVLVDGRPASAVPAQLAFSALPLEAGAHRIEWQEAVPGLEVSRWGPALFALAATWLLVSRPRKSPREPSA